MMDARAIVAGLMLLCGASYYLGYQNAPREILDSEVKYDGIFRTDTVKVLSATVESLRLENKLLVFSYKGSVKVEAERTLWWIFGGRQELIIPALVPYYLDLSKLTLANVDFDEKAKLVKVKLPPLELGDIAFQPENATTTNGGILTFSEEQVEALRKMNYANARKAMIKQAQGKGLFDTAKRQARENIASYFEIPLRIAGKPDVKVLATF